MDATLGRAREMTGGDVRNIDVILKRFETPDEVREMVKGRFELVQIGGLTIGRATYEAGWRWSEHVGPGGSTAVHRRTRGAGPGWNSGGGI